MLVCFRNEETLILCFLYFLKIKTLFIHSPHALSSISRAFQFKGEGGRGLFGEKHVSEPLLSYQLPWNAEPFVH